MRVELPRRPLRPVLFLVALALGLSRCVQASDVTIPTVPPHTTLVVFADHYIPDDEWNDLFAALRKNLPDATAKSRSIDPDPDLLRGDQVTVGLRVESSLIVYLHGDCILIPQFHRDIWGEALGWVREIDGHIEPFVHVECTQIRQMLGPSALSMDSDQRTAVMSEAIARVILHEWIHVATQNAAHGAAGIFKSSFGVPDLIPESGRPDIPRRQARKKSAPSNPAGQ